MSQRQLFFLSALAIPAYKIAMLPSFFASIGGRDMWISVLLPLLLDVLVLGGIFLIKQKVGVLSFSIPAFKYITYGLAIILALYFLLQITVFSEETLSYLLQSFFDEGERLQISIPIIFASCYLAHKGAKSLGRVCDVLIWFLGFAILISLLFNTADFDFSNLKPILDGEKNKKLFGGINGYFWFCDYLPLLFIDIRDKKKQKFGLVFGGTIVLSLSISAVFAVFVAQWGDLTASVPNAFARLSGYNMISADVGKVDWIAILSWLTSCTTKLALLFLGIKGAIKYVFSEKVTKFVLPISGLLSVLGLVFFVKDIRIAYSVGQSMSVPSLILGVGAPVVLLLFTLFSKRVKNNNYERLNYENTQK